MLNLKQGKKRGKEKISLLNVNGKLIRNQQTTANSFNEYFLTIAEKLTRANQIHKLSQLKNRAPIHYIPYILEPNQHQFLPIS